MKFFLKIKAWQLFILIFALPCGVHIVVTGWGAATENSGLTSILMPFVWLIYMPILLGWIWTLGTQLNKRVPEDIRPKSGFFRLGVCYNAIYAPFHSSYFLLQSTNRAYAKTFAVILIPFFLLAVLCIFYSLYFISKNFIMAEKQEKAPFNDVIETALLIWFFPIGVWFIQPRVNRLFQNGQGAQEDTVFESSSNVGTQSDVSV